MTTTQPAKSRRQKLEAFLVSRPGDAFALYGLALECAREGDHDAAIANFETLLAAHPDYVAGYFQLGQLFARLARIADSRRVLTEGVAAAVRAGDAHAESEI
ncbi:MAG: tetratricopeptide repeat protein, partial [Bryobacteraceae bacterium]